MIIKKYKNMSSKSAAAMIAEECIRYGSSANWSGSTQEKDDVAEILENYNIRYADDSAGEWRLRPPLTGSILIDSSRVIELCERIDSAGLSEDANILVRLHETALKAVTLSSNSSPSYLQLAENEYDTLMRLK